MLIEKKEADKDRLENIDRPELDCLKFDEKERQIVGRIGKMCTYYLQQEFFAMKDLSKSEFLMPQDFRDNLKTQYTFKNWSTKSSAFNRLEKLDYTTYKLIEEYRSSAQVIFAELTNMTLSIEQIDLLKLLNRLRSFFSTYSNILNKPAIEDKSFHKLYK